MLLALAAMVNLFSYGLVYLLAWGLALLIGHVVMVPAWLRPGLPWLLFNIYVVAGLFVSGDLPGAPRSTFKLLATAAVASLALGLVASIWTETGRQLTVESWTLGGTLPWLLASVAELLAF